MSECTVDECEALVRVGTIPCDKELHDVCVTDDRASAQADLTHIIDVSLGNEIVHAVEGTQGQHERQHHTEARENRTGHEVRWEDRGMPAR